ncbi:hypothetical protein AMECASPLE_032379 [Ameca splendens]|uniref:Uncharacterized protein n=1 Tax=Ameca splendens TaxID=208324 RepID=A0ABV0Y6F4_9TELE
MGQETGVRTLTARSADSWREELQSNRFLTYQNLTESYAGHCFCLRDTGTGGKNAAQSHTNRDIWSP